VAIFKKNPINIPTASNLIDIPKNGSIVSLAMHINGDIKIDDALIIKGEVTGDIISNSIVVVLENGVVKGNIEAKECRIDSILTGNIKAILVEINKSAKVKGDIFANSALIDGKVDGNINIKESLECTINADINAKECKAQIIVAEGKIDGFILATKLLDVKKDAAIRGKIFAKELKSDFGCTIEGLVNIYKLDSNLAKLI